ncbi:MAG: TerB family tellurite resistance protein [Kiritimatiellae bacterium]|nr:TerB family tellurite resistance protein [Kiritimatiellia bacterium]
MNPWIAGALGWWILGGPLGGIIAFLGAAFWNAAKAKENQGASQGASRRPPPPPPPRGGAAGRASASSASSGDDPDPRFSFTVSLMVLVAAVMMADGRASRDELGVVKAFLRDNFDADTARSCLQILKGLLGKTYNVPPVCRQIRRHMDIASRRTLLHLLYGIAWADGALHRNENALLTQIAFELGIPAAEARSIAAMFERRGPDPDADYAILGVPPTATDAEVRTAYRRMAQKHHPDKVAHLGPDVQRAATEKFRTINEAWERIKKSRDIK